MLDGYQSIAYLVLLLVGATQGDHAQISGATTYASQDNTTDGISQSPFDDCSCDTQSKHWINWSWIVNEYTFSSWSIIWRSHSDTLFTTCTWQQQITYFIHMGCHYSIHVVMLEKQFTASTVQCRNCDTCHSWNHQTHLVRIDSTTCHQHGSTSATMFFFGKANVGFVSCSRTSYTIIRSEYSISTYWNRISLLLRRHCIGKNVFYFMYNHDDWQEYHSFQNFMVISSMKHLQQLEHSNNQQLPITTYGWWHFNIWSLLSPKIIVSWIRYIQ